MKDLTGPKRVCMLAAQVTKARMDRNVAAGYDPTGQWGKNSFLAGEDLAHLGDEEEEEDEEDVGAEQDRHSSRAAEDPADDGDFPDMPAEESDEVGLSNIQKP